MNVKNLLYDDQGEPIAGVIGEPFENYVPPSWDVYFMRQVYEVASKSKDPSTKIGAVIVREKRPILFGYNGIPPDVQDYPERMERPNKYRWFEHGERNAIYCGAAFGIATQGTTLYTQALPCCPCARGILGAKIKEVVLHKIADEIFAHSGHYASTWKEDHETTLQMFKEAGIEVRYVDMFVGKVAYISGKRYNI